VDALGDDGEHAGHVAVDCLAAGCGKRKVSALNLVRNEACKSYLARRPWP
jgi:hypothetical protein